MKSTTISYTNPKGQIVIPKEYRDSLDIDESVALLFKLVGKNIILTPVKSVITESDEENSFFEILRKTRGKWGRVSTKSAKEKRKVELKASRRRRKKW